MNGNEFAPLPKLCNVEKILSQKQNIVININQHFVKISAPVLVIKMVCSNCAAGLPSAVKVVQLSGHVTHLIPPIVRIGSATRYLKQIVIIQYKRPTK